MVVFSASIPAHRGLVPLSGSYCTGGPEEQDREGILFALSLLLQASSQLDASSCGLQHSHLQACARKLCSERRRLAGSAGHRGGKLLGPSREYKNDGADSDTEECGHGELSDMGEEGEEEDRERREDGLSVGTAAALFPDRPLQVHTCVGSNGLPTAVCALEKLDLRFNNFLDFCERPWELGSASDRVGSLNRVLDDKISISASSGGATGAERGPLQGHHGAAPMDVDGAAHIPAIPHSASSQAPGCDPWAQFAASLLADCPRLRVLDISYCATTYRQADCLCSGLVQALQKRSRRHLPSLEAVRLRGLASSYPQLAYALRTALTAHDGHSLIGVQELDVSGFDRRS